MVTNTFSKYPNKGPEIVCNSLQCTTMNIFCRTNLLQIVTSLKCQVMDLSVLLLWIALNKGKYLHYMQHSLTRKLVNRARQKAHHYCKDSYFGLLFLFICIENQWWRDLFRCRIDLLNFSMGFNIVAHYMEFLHLNWYLAEWWGMNYMWTTWRIIKSRSSDIKGGGNTNSLFLLLF